MKAYYSLIFVVLFVFSLFSTQSYGQTDTTQVRYVKFTTHVSADYTRIALQEIKAFSNGHNVAPENVITTNSHIYDYNVNAIIDDDESTPWYSDDYSTLTSDMGCGPTPNHPHYIVVDLGSAYTLQNIKLNLDAGWSFVYTFDLMVSADAQTWELIGGRNREGGTFDFSNMPSTPVRYIKYNCYYSSDQGQVNVHEIEAYSTGVNVALNKTVTASSYEYGDANTNGANAVDGNASTRWSSDRGDYIPSAPADSAEISAIIDFKQIVSIDSLRLTFHSSRFFKLMVSANGTDWLVVDQRNNDQNQYSYLLNHRARALASLISQGKNKAMIYGVISANSESGIGTRGVCWSTSPQPTTSDQKTESGTGPGKYFIHIEGLTENSIYYVRAYFIKGAETIYSNEIRFLSGLNIQTDVVTEVQNESAKAGGYVSAGSGIQISERGICWAETSNPDLSGNYVACGTEAGEFNTTLTNLTSEIKYYVRAYVTTSQGTFYGNEVFFKQRKQKFMTNTNGFFPNEIFTESGEMNGYKYYSSTNGYSLYFDGYSWLLGDFVTSSDAGNPPLTGWWDGTEIYPLTTPAPSISSDKNSLTESNMNNGSFSETITITHDHINNAIFTGSDQEDFVKTAKVMYRNLPEGLELKVIRNSDLSVTISLQGRALSHGAQQSISNLKIMFLQQAFSNGYALPTDGSIVTVALNFTDPTTITVTGTKSSADYVIGADNDVILDTNSSFNIDASTTANQLIVKAGASLAVSNTLTVNHLILEANDTASFSALATSQLTINGAVYFEKEMSDSSTYMLSFPCRVRVTDITVNGQGAAGEDYYIYSYNGAGRATSGEADSWVVFDGDSLQANQGYAFRLKAGSGTQTMVFKLKNSVMQPTTELSIPVSFYDGNSGDNHKGWNLISQPYLNKMAGSAVGIHYITTHKGNSYHGLVNSQVSTLNPFEAFFVQVAEPTAIPCYLTGQQGIRSLVNRDLTETVQLNISSTTGTDFSTLIFDNERTSLYEIGQDLEKWISTSSYEPQIYSTVSGVNYAFNALPVSEVVNLPIGIYSKAGGASTLSASNIHVSGLSKLMLNDSQTGASTDLNTASYEFTANAGSNNNRFSITIQRVWTDADLLNGNNAPYAYVQNSQLIIRNLAPDTHIRLYDATGRILLNKQHVQTGTYQIALTQAGMYMVQVEANTGTHNLKVLNK